MKKRMKKIFALAMMTMLLICFSAPVFAAADTEDKTGETAAVAEETGEEEAESSSTGNKAWAAAICVGLAAAMGAISMGLAIAKTNEGIARQPEAEGKLRTSLMLGLVFIEKAIIYALIVAILIIFVL